jgi:hypothetical protein
MDDKVFFLLCEEAGRLGEVEEEKVGGDGDDDCDDALEDEDPAPALETTDAVHLGDGEG